MKTEDKYKKLFSPIEIGSVRLKNRLIHAAITTYFAQNGQVSEKFINYCSNRAKGGAGAIILEPVNMLTSQTNPRKLQVFGGQHQEGLKRLVQAVEGEDCRLFAQVQDSGRGRREQGRNEQAVGASALADDLSWSVPHVLSQADIRQMVDEFAQSCGLLQQAGFSGVEISAGHGHLFHQFLSCWSNHRQDEYGGNLENRTRFVRQVIQAIRAECGKKFALGVKMPGEDGVAGSIDLAEAFDLAERVARTGEVDYWTFAWGTHASSLYQHLPDAHGAHTPYAGAISKLRKADGSIATGALGYITDPNEAERLLEDGTADLIMLGRPLITDPAWGIKAMEGRESEIRYCVSCNSCWRMITESGHLECDNNPRVGRADEVDWSPTVTQSPKRIIVVGSGIAGLEAAWVSALRGHDVTIIGKSREMGGKTRLHAELPGGENLSSIYDYQALTAKRHGVKFDLGVEADLDLIKSYNPHIVILATGSRMSWPAFLPADYKAEGFFPDLRELVADFVARRAPQAGKLVIYDHDHTEMTYGAALFFADLFEEVILVTPRERIATDVSLVTRQSLYSKLYKKRVRIITSSEPLSTSAFEDGKITIANIYNGDETEIEDISVVTYATPRVPNDALLSELNIAGIEAHAIGDCYAPRSVLAATREGHALAEKV